MSQIFIELSQNFFYVGDTVSGHIFLNVTKDFSDGKIKLKLKGWESAQWIDMIRIHEDPNNPRPPPNPDDLLSGSDCEISQSSTDSSDAKIKTKRGYFRNKQGELYNVVHHAGGKEFLKIDIPINSFGKGQVMAGQYKIPFQFMLNPEFPGTFCQKSDKYKGRIKYEMRVKCELDDGKEREFKHKIELMVHERPGRIQSEEKKITASVMCCCCIPKGETTFKVKFEKNTYIIGETAKMMCEVDNSNCSSNVNDIEASLIHRTELKDKNGQRFVFSKSLISKKFGGVAAGEKAIDKDCRHEQLKLENKMKSKKKVINPSTDGKFVKSEYFLEVECNMDATCNGCCNKVPKVKTSVQIYPQLFSYNQFQLPMNWNPQTLPAYNIPVGYNAPPNMMQQGMQPQMMQQGMQPQMQQGMQPQMMQPMNPMQQYPNNNGVQVNDIQIQQQH